MKELEEEENLLKQCIEKLKSAEASRVALVSQLKEALHEQVNCMFHNFPYFKKPLPVHLGQTIKH